MADMEKAVATQLANIQKKTGKSMDELAQVIRRSGLERHGEIRDMLKRDLGLGHGDANTLVHAVLKSDGTRAAAGKGSDAVLDEIYSGPKAAFRPIHELLMVEIERFGLFEVAPKKGYVSLRRQKQFATIGPATNTRLEVGLNFGDAPGTARLEQLPPKQMCSHKVKLTEASQVDGELLGWIRKAFDRAG